MDGIINLSCKDGIAPTVWTVMNRLITGWYQMDAGQ
jgi:hypothetical protein